jgi:ADP-heptose:LPS heptosyltransferase
MFKVLIIRLSSIGDIVLTTPVIRCLKQQKKKCEVHFLVKKQFLQVVAHNPFIDKIHVFDDNLTACIQNLKKEGFTYILDLHNNQRSLLIKWALLGVKAYAFNKLNIQKWLMVNAKVNHLPKVHIVTRYLDTVKELGVINDGKGLDYFIDDTEKIDRYAKLGLAKNTPFIAMVIGGSFATKQLPKEKLLNVCELIEKPLVLLGGPSDAENAQFILENLPHKTNIYNACGLFSLNQSASIVQQSTKVITHDTGLMHIAAAFNKPILSIWGNTIPDFGMYPYLPKNSLQIAKILEVKDLNCRPCSKLGYHACPKKHFNCMNLINENDIADWANE